jgi:CO/xanthine dehydrogenase Mo-binding subunit
MKNLLTNGGTFATGERLDDCHFRELLVTVAERIGWDHAAPPERHGARVRAKGLSCIIKGTVTPSTSTASAKLNDDGSLDIATSSVEMGQGAHTALAAIAAEALAIPVEGVRVSYVDTDVTPYDQQTSSSRTTHAMGHAVTGAVEEIRQQLVERAAEALEAAAGDLELVDGSVRVRGTPQSALSYSQVVRGSRGGSLLGRGRFQSEGGLDPETGQGIGAVHWHQAAGAAEVEVDLETGRVEVVRYESAVYTGRTVNAVQCELQAEGNVAFGLGQSLYEQMVYDNGQLQNGNLGDYMIASMADMPDLGLVSLEHPERLEIHGIGETGLPPVMPAVANAVFRATGVRIRDLPLTAEKVLRGLRELEASHREEGAAGELAEAGTTAR